MSPIQIAAVALLALITMVVGFFLTEDFWNVHFLKKDWVRCIFRNPSRKMKGLWLKPSPQDGSGVTVVTYKNGEYPIEAKCKNESGFFNVPTYYFIEGVFTGIELAGPKNTVSAQQIKNMRKWHIFTDIMNAVDVSPISQTWMLVILAGLIIISAAVLYYVLGNKIEDTILPLIPVTPTPFLGSSN